MRLAAAGRSAAQQQRLDLFRAGDSFNSLGVHKRWAVRLFRYLYRKSENPSIPEIYARVLDSHYASVSGSHYASGK